MMRRWIGIVCACALAACGGSARLSDLRCDGACQSPADPFLLTLAVTFDDPAKELETSRLLVHVDGKPALAADARDLMAPAGAPAGTIRFQVPLKFRTVTDKQEFLVEVHTDGLAGASNSLSRVFAFHL